MAPYGLTLAAQATLHLNAALTQAFGATTTVSIADSTPYGAEDDIDAAAVAGSPALLAVLFPLTATPEGENHGVFVDRLKASAGAARIALMVDESAFRRQFGADSSRLTERRDLWQRFAGGRGLARGLAVVFIDLDQPPTPSARESLRRALDRTPGP